MSNIRELLWSGQCLFVLQAFLFAQTEAAARSHEGEDSKKYNHVCTFCLSSSIKPDSSKDNDIDKGPDGLEDTIALSQVYEPSHKVSKTVSIGITHLSSNNFRWRSWTTRAPPA